jgi:CheY-like chemotaxis protein
MGGRFNIGGGTSLDAAQRDLQSRNLPSPRLYVLDLYFPEHGSSTPAQRQQIADERQNVLAAQAKFDALLARLGQKTDGGSRLADRLSRFGWRPPFVFFSRKASAEDVVRALDEGAIRVIKKPDPTPEEMGGDIETAYDMALTRSANDVARDIEDAIIRSSPAWKYGQLAIAFLIGFVSSALAGSISAGLGTLLAVPIVWLASSAIPLMIGVWIGRWTKRG